MPTYGSSHDREQPIPPYRPRPAPDVPGGLPVTDGKEDDLGAADEVFERDIADLAEHAAVGRVVAVVAHHEVMPGRHVINLGVVEKAVVLEIERLVAHAAGQRLAPPFDAHR